MFDADREIEVLPVTDRVADHFIAVLDDFLRDASKRLRAIGDHLQDLTRIHVLQRIQRIHDGKRSRFAADVEDVVDVEVLVLSEIEAHE